MRRRSGAERGRRPGATALAGVLVALALGAVRPASADPATSSPPSAPATRSAALPGSAAPPPTPPDVAAPPPAALAVGPVRGTVRPARQVTLRARLDGVVETVAVEEGDTVEAGQLLLALDDAVQAARVAAAEAAARSTAEVRNAALELKEARHVLGRTEQAARAGAVTDWELRNARTRAEQTAMALQAAEERHELDARRLEQEQALLAQYRLLAPFAGRVTRVEVEQGATVAQDDPVATVVALDRLEAVLFLPVGWFGALEVGRRYALAAEHPVDRPLEGRLEAVDPTIDPGSRTVRCLFAIDNPGSALPAGFTVRLDPPAGGGEHVEPSGS